MFLSRHCGISDDEMNDTIDNLWSEYQSFNNKNGPFGGEYFIWSSKNILQGNSHIWYQKYFLHCTKVLVFLECRVTSKIIGMGAAERYWGDVKTNKSGNR